MYRPQTYIIRPDFCVMLVLVPHMFTIEFTTSASYGSVCKYVIWHLGKKSPCCLWRWNCNYMKTLKVYKLTKNKWQSICLFIRLRINTLKAIQFLFAEGVTATMPQGMKRKGSLSVISQVCMQFTSSTVIIIFFKIV